MASTFDDVPTVYLHGAAPLLTKPVATTQLLNMCALKVDSLLDTPIDTYYMWVSPHDNPNSHIYLYTSPAVDGPWTLYSETGVIVTSIISGGAHLGSPWAVWVPESEEIYMYFHAGVGGTQPTYLAKSSDGINFTLYGSSPVLPAGASGSWDHSLTAYASQIRVTSTDWRMWYQGNDGAGADNYIGYATSSDGLTWTKYAGNPVLTPDGIIERAAPGVSAPYVLYKDAVFYMYYNSQVVGTPDLVYPYNQWGQLCLARSADGITWERHPTANPILKGTGGASWDSNTVKLASPFYDDGVVYLFYTGGDGVTDNQISLATPGVDYVDYGITISSEDMQSIGVTPLYERPGIVPLDMGTPPCKYNVPRIHRFVNTGNELILLKNVDYGDGDHTHLIQIDAVCCVVTLSPNRGTVIGPFPLDQFDVLPVITYDNRDLCISILRDVPG